MSLHTECIRCTRDKARVLILGHEYLHTSTRDSRESKSTAGEGKNSCGEVLLHENHFGNSLTRQRHKERKALTK